jgi:hypothetical protein
MDTRRKKIKTENYAALRTFSGAHISEQRYWMHMYNNFSGDLNIYNT